jgi:polysaccharide pyruvyl transferase WcaK-like protein
MTLVESRPRQRLNLNQDNKKSLLLAWRNLRAYSKDTTRDNFEIIARYCLELYREHQLEQITIMDMDSWQDNRVGMKFVEILNSLEPSIPVNHHTTKDYLEKYQLIAKADLILTSRLHVAVCAHYLNIKCLTYNYSPKIQYFVDECGNSDIVLLEKNLKVR